MPKTRPLTLEELSSMLPRIEATVAMLIGAAHHSSAKAAPHSNGRRKGNGRRKAKGATKAKGRRGARAGADKIQAKLLGTLARSKSGLSLGQLIKKSGVKRSAAKYYLRKLRGEQRTRVVGDRRQARWFAK